MTSVSAEVMQKELDDTLHELSALNPGDRPRYFRPPQGRYNATLLRALRKRGLSNVMWTYSLSDYGDATQASVWRRFEAVMLRYNPRELGLIGVQHFCQGPGTPDLIPRMATLARARGWEFVTLDECLGAVPLRVLPQRSPAETLALRAAAQSSKWPKPATASIGVPWLRTNGARGPND